MNHSLIAASCNVDASLQTNQTFSFCPNKRWHPVSVRVLFQDELNVFIIIHLIHSFIHSFRHHETWVITDLFTCGVASSSTTQCLIGFIHVGQLKRVLTSSQPFAAHPAALLLLSYSERKMLARHIKKVTSVLEALGRCNSFNQNTWWLLISKNTVEATVKSR